MLKSQTENVEMQKINVEKYKIKILNLLLRAMAVGGSSGVGGAWGGGGNGHGVPRWRPACDINNCGLFAQIANNERWGR